MGVCQVHNASPYIVIQALKSQRYTKECNVNESIVKDFIDIYSDATITPENVFYYVYGVFNSPEYSRRFNSNFTKE